MTLSTCRSGHILCPPTDSYSHDHLASRRTLLVIRLHLESSFRILIHLSLDSSSNIKASGDVGHPVTIGQARFPSPLAKKIKNCRPPQSCCVVILQFWRRKPLVAPRELHKIRHCVPVTGVKETLSRAGNLDHWCRYPPCKIW